MIKITMMPHFIFLIILKIRYEYYLKGYLRYFEKKRWAHNLK